MGLMDFLKKDFDTILEEILADLRSNFPDVDTSKGSLEFARAAAHASAEWGILQAVKYVYRQRFPDTADTAGIEEWAYSRGLNRKPGETDAELVQRILNNLQEPPAGGNDNDYEQWALEVDNVTRAYCYPRYLGLGTVGVLVLADEAATGSEIPSDHTDVSGTTDSVSAGKLVDSGATFVTDGVAPGDKVKNIDTGAEATVSAVDSETQLSLSADIFTATGQGYELTSLVRQVMLYINTLEAAVIAEDSLGVFGPTVKAQNIEMNLAGEDADPEQAKLDVEAYMRNLEPDQTLFLSQLQAIGIQNGADNVTITTPAADVVPVLYEMIRPGTVTVT